VLIATTPNYDNVSWSDGFTRSTLVFYTQVTSVLQIVSAATVLATERPSQQLQVPAETDRPAFSK